MPRMIDAVRNSTLPSNMMQFAAKGALLVPSQEMIEILVHLAKHNKVFGQQARLTLAGWDEASSRQAAANPETPKEVLDYFIDPENLRPALLPALLENVSVNENFLVHLAASGSREQVELLLNSPRASCSRAVLEVLAASPTLTAAATARVREKLSALADAKVSAGAVAEVGQVTATNLSGAPAAHAGIQEHSSDVPDEAVHAFMSQHAAEIAAEGDKPFQPVSALHEDLPAEAAEIPADAKSMAAAAAAGNSEATPAVHKTVEKKWVLSAEEQRGSALQKIAKLDIKGRVLLAMKGTKEERSLLIRDGTKIVAFAVLESPKLTDGEVEKFASQKNVLESVLREISIKRRFIKQYPVVRSLTFNPRTPIDVSLGLLKHLLIQDLRSLAGNKEVSDTVRKLASKMFRQKLEVKKS